MEAQAIQDGMRIKDVHYTGSDEMQSGYALCYDRDRGTASEVDPNRYLYVEKPAAGNLEHFAGVVHAGYANKTGPCWLKIIEPIGRSFEVHTDQNCTQLQTYLTVKPGSYALGGVGQGIPVARVLQTVDRSSTAGLVQALLWGVDPRDITWGVAAPSATVRTFSQAIWETCPWNLLRYGQMHGYAFETDFRAVGGLANNAGATLLGRGVFGTTAATGGTIISNETDEPYGVLSLQSTTDDEDAIISIGGGVPTYGGGAFIFNSAKKLWMEARIKQVNITNSKFNMFCGFAEEGLLATTTLLTAADAMADKDYVGFQRPFAAGADIDTVHNTASGGGATQVKDKAITVEADTYHNVGMYSDGTTLYFFNNGVVLDDSVLLAADNFPNGEEMAFYFGLMLGHGDTASAQIDRLRIAQTA